MQEYAQSYAAIVKQEKLEDGTLRVYGKATDDSIDVDQQICDSDWLKQAMPDWFVSGGNIREQHSNIAAGVATDYEEKADGHYITALVVDPTSIKKVETKVLKGFSIGIRGPRVIRDNKAAGGRIVDGQIVEISLVDRPANPNAKLMLAKAADSGELMSVNQVNIPLPNEVFKNDEATVEAAIEVVEPEAIIEEVVEEVVEATIEETADKAAELVNNAKALIATLNKFDQTFYDDAIKALSQLIVVEANEQIAGSNEVESITQLLESVKHLFAWYSGEVAEGEVAMVNDAVVEETEEILMAAKSDSTEIEKDVAVVCDCGHDGCETKDGCGDKMCKCSGMDKAVEEEEIPTEPITEQVKEVDDLAVALEAEQEKSAKLQAELDAAKALSVGGGPKRTTLNKTAEVNVDDLLQKASQLRAKAAAQTDKILAKGYSAWASELEAQAGKGQ